MVLSNTAPKPTKKTAVPSFSLRKALRAVKSSSKPSLSPEDQRKAEAEKLQKQLEEKQRREDAEHQRKLIAKDVKAAPKTEAPVDDEPLDLPQKKRFVKKRSLKDLLLLAGIDLDPFAVYKKIFQTAVLVNLAITGIALIIGFFFRNSFSSTHEVQSFIIFAIALWTVWFAALCILLMLSFMVYLDLRIAQRRKEIETVFPDYLQLASANLSAGMTVDRALWSAVRPRFGVLAKEIEDVAKKTMTGYDLERALLEFSEKYDSDILKRSVNLIVEGIHSGGRMADILNKISINLQENAILQKEMSANVTTYVIFISFASVVAAPFLFGLSTQLLIVIKSIAGSIGGTSSSNLGLAINPNVVSTSDFRTFVVVILTVSSIMSACIVSIIRKGTVREGLRLIPFFWFVSIVLYYISSWGLGLMFGGLIG